MKEYICKEEAINLIKSFDDSSLDDYYRAGLLEAEIGILHMPAADVVEVRYGRWLKQKNETYLPVEFDENDESILHKYIYYKCSLCGRTENQKEPYCNCGAKMDKEN